MEKTFGEPSECHSYTEEPLAKFQVSPQVSMPNIKYQLQKLVDKLFVEPLIGRGKSFKRSNEQYAFDSTHTLGLEGE